MSDIAMLMDSTTVIPPAWDIDYGVTVIPVPIHAGGKEYRDGVDITAEQFISLLETSKERPSTAVPGLGEFLSFYERLLQQHRNIIYPVPSTKLTGLFNAAIQAAKQINDVRIIAIDPPREWEEEVYAVDSSDLGAGDRLAEIRSWDGPVITVVNTGYASGATGLVAMEGCKAIREGMALDETLRRMMAAKRGSGVYFILPTLDYVVDRAGYLRAFLGMLLKLKPILAIQNGSVEDVARVRGWSKAKSQMLDLVQQRVGDRQVDIYALHSLAQDEAEALLEQAKLTLKVRDSWVGGIGCTVSRYTGRGGLGIAFRAL
jgi:fatty acid-binding protein DegV